MAQLNALRELCAAGLWHGTTADNAASIASNGYVRASKDGFFGPGVYLTSSRSKATAWARSVSYWSGSDPVIVCVKVNIGRCKVFAMCDVECVHSVRVDEYVDFHCSEIDMLGRPVKDRNRACPELSWLTELIFDSQYVPETWPNFDELHFFAGDQDDIWPDAMRGDELVLRNECDATYKFVCEI